jgi:NAD(P)-dependent dehydrogenase (short-subunit alcohol dehydrogenase family)
LNGNTKTLWHATALFGRLRLPAGQLSEVTASLLPLKRLGRPDEIASAVLYLASAESAYIFGIELVADGGMRRATQVPKS